MTKRILTLEEIAFLKEALNSDYKFVSIRLREGEYQHILAKAIASFQLALHFPNVKELIKELYGENKTNDVQFIRKIQTILKKMEKSNVVRILKKKKPWELQRYALLSFKFQDIDKNFVVLATDGEVKKAQKLLEFALSQQEKTTARLNNDRIKIYLLSVAVIVLYMIVLWELMQLSVNPIVFILAFLMAVMCSLKIGELLSRSRV